MKKIIIIGSRQRNTDNDYQIVYNMFKKYYNIGDIIVSGGCPKGADHFADLIASRCNIESIIHLPVKPDRGSPRWAWARAMFDRNTIVANEVDKDSIVIACVVNPEDKIESVLKRKSGGTEDTLKKIQNKGFKNNIIIV